MDSQLVKRLESYTQTNKVACIIDEIHYSYDDLLCKAKAVFAYDDLEDSITIITNSERKLVWIESESTFEQLTLWLGSLVLGYIPVMSHRNMDKSYKSNLLHMLSTMKIPEEAQFGVLTSGTTGMPKPLWRTESSWIDFFDIQNEVFSIDESTRLFMHGSFSFTGNTNMMLGVLWAGGTIVSSDKMQPKRWLNYIDTFVCTHIYMLPTKLRLLLRHYHHPLEYVQHIISGSQLIDTQLLDELETMCPHMEFILYYGASELNYITYCSGADWRNHPNTVGKPFDNVQVSIQAGCIYVNTAYAICGIHGPTTINDRGYWDEEFLIFEGRQGDVINRGGYKVSIQSLESKLQLVSEISEVCVIGVPHALRGEEVVAFIVPKKDSEYQALEKIIRATIPLIEQPKYIRFVDSLPLTDSSKIDRVKLKEWYNKG